MDKIQAQLKFNQADYEPSPAQRKFLVSSLYNFESRAEPSSAQFKFDLKTY